MKRVFVPIPLLEEHFDAEDRIPLVHAEYVEALRTLNNRRSDRLDTRADWELVAELTGQLARLHATETNYYTSLNASYADQADNRRETS